MGAVDKTITSATDTAGTVGEAALSVSRAGRQPARDMMYMGLKGAAIALRGTSFVCGKCADGLDATAALARGAAGMARPIGREEIARGGDGTGAAARLLSHYARGTRGQYGGTPPLSQRRIPARAMQPVLGEAVVTRVRQTNAPHCGAFLHPPLGLFSYGKSSSATEYSRLNPFKKISEH